MGSEEVGKTLNGDAAFSEARFPDQCVDHNGLALGTRSEQKKRCQREKPEPTTNNDGGTNQNKLGTGGGQTHTDLSCHLLSFLQDVFCVFWFLQLCHERGENREER